MVYILLTKIYWSQQTTSSNNTRDDSTCGHHQMVNTEIRLITFFATEDGEALYSQEKTRPGADCGSDHELLIEKFRLKLKKAWKTTRPFRFDLNQIPYDYIGGDEQIKGTRSDRHRVPEELWTEVCNIVQEVVT